MLYYLGDEYTDVTGGWTSDILPKPDPAWATASKAPTISRYEDYIEATMTVNNCGVLRTVNTFDATEYSMLVMFVKYANVTNEEARLVIGNSGITYCESQADKLVTIIKYGSSQTVTNKMFAVDISSISGNKFGYIYFIRYNNTSVVRISFFGLFMQDNISGLSAYGADIASILANASSLLADKEAVKYMVYNCTGDFMASAIANSGFISALNASPNKNMVLGNEHWAKFLALV